jgi:hypothetical protein
MLILTTNSLNYDFSNKVGYGKLCGALKARFVSCVKFVMSFVL